MVSDYWIDTHNTRGVKSTLPAFGVCFTYNVIKKKPFYELPMCEDIG